MSGFRPSPRRLPALFLVLLLPLVSPGTQELMLEDRAGHLFSASSSLDGYGMELLFDGDGYTGWSEGHSGAGEGTVLWVVLDPGADTLLLRNGFARNRELFAKNNRVRTLELALYRGFQPAGMVTETGPLFLVRPLSAPAALTLEDAMALQEHALPFEEALLAGRSPSAEDFRFYREQADAKGLPPDFERSDILLRMEITGVYPGNTWNDTCLTELRVFPREGFSTGDVFEEEGVLHYLGPSAPRVLYREREFLFDPFLVADDGSWCVAFRSPAEAQGRVETSCALFELPRPEPSADRRFAGALEAGRIPVDFEKRGTGLFLVFDDGSEMELRR